MHGYQSFAHFLGFPTGNLEKCTGRVAQQAWKIASNLRSQAPGQIGSGSFLSDKAFWNNGALQSFLIGSFLVARVGCQTQLRATEFGVCLHWWILLWPLGCKQLVKRAFHVCGTTPRTQKERSLLCYGNEGKPVGDKWADPHSLSWTESG